MTRRPLSASQMAFDFDALLAPPPEAPKATFTFREKLTPSRPSVGTPFATSDDEEGAPCRIIEIEGVRAIYSPGRWRCFYAIDPGKPFVSETGFMSGASKPAGSSEECFASLIVERRAGKKGKLPIPATTYRLPQEGEDGPQPASGALLALKALKSDPYNVALIIESSG